MARRTRKVDEDETSFTKEEPVLVNPDKDLNKEDKVEWLKRRAKEDKEIKEVRSKPMKEWLELNGHKVLLCGHKKGIGTFRKYWFNKKKFPDAFEQAKKKYEVKPT